MFPSSFREASPEQKQRGAGVGQACSFTCIYIPTLETKSINSPGQQVISGESSFPFPLSFPAGVAVLDLGQRDRASSATSSGILKAGE